MPDNAEKYSGVWTPDMGTDDAEDSRSPSPQSSYASPTVYDRAARAREDRAKVIAWMRGHKPLVRWSMYGRPGKPFRVLTVRFPYTTHLVEAYEHPEDKGGVVVWCFGCDSDQCVGCKWANPIFRKLYIGILQRAQEKREEGLPF